MGWPGVGRVRAALLPRCLLGGFQQKMLSSPWRPSSWQLCLPAGQILPRPLELQEAPWPRPRAREPRQKGTVQHDRDFQLRRYLRIGQLMVSAEPFSIGEANTI